jgi:hypothetical protein
MSNSIIDKVVEHLATLPDSLQRQVLEFVQTLKASIRQGVPGRELLQFAGAIPLDDLQLMRQAIEAGCEQVELDEW